MKTHSIIVVVALAAIGCSASEASDEEDVVTPPSTARAVSAVGPEEPLLLTALSGPTGSTAPARYVSSGEIEAAYLWPLLWTVGPAIPAPTPATLGAPCSRTPLAAGRPVPHRIQAMGIYRRCI